MVNDDSFLHWRPWPQSTSWDHWAPLCDTHITTTKQCQKPWHSSTAKTFFRQIKNIFYKIQIIWGNWEGDLAWKASFHQKPSIGKCTWVPGVIAAGPWQHWGEGAEEVEECPGEDDDVVDVQIGLNDLCRISKSCEGKQRLLRQMPTSYVSSLAPENT